MDKRRPMTPEENKKVLKFGLILMTCSTIFLLSSFFLIYYDVIRVHTQRNIDNFHSSLSARLVYTLKYQTLLIFWLLFNVLATIYVRIRNMALNPLIEESEKDVMAIKSILTNSFESIFISVISQFIFVCFADPINVLKFIPYVNYVQFIGRITFLIGYPLKRAFGYHLTAWPNIILVFYNLFRFGSFVGLY